MSRPDDFDILSDEPNKPGRSNRWWLWLLIATAAIFVFAVGMALATFTNRLGGGDDASSTATALAAVVTYTATPNDAGTTTTAVPTTITPLTTPLTTPAVNIEATATDAVASTATDQPTAIPVVPTAIPTSGCSRTIPAQFGPVYRAELGCPTNDAGIVWSAWEWFERGAMFWRDDNDRAYTFFNDGGWGTVDEKWEGEDLSSRGDPPTGLQAPVRGFGYAWGRRDDLFQRLGWATDQERGFCALIQSFEHGFILQDSDVDACKDNLFNQVHAGEWRPLFIVAVEGSGWLNLAGTTLPTPIATTTPGTPVTTPGLTPETTITETPTGTPTIVPTATPGTVQRQRPEGNRLFYAANGTHSLDGNLADWGGNWIPITAVVEGSANYSGSDDANGDFQMSWSLEGLYLAIRVHDDRYRAGPNGSDMWQGDGLELHFDRDLSGDYADNFANGDDYQLGLSWGPDRNETRLYRWLPQTAEGTFPVSGAVVPDGEGYSAELLIPWPLFDVTSGQLQADQRFGFNLSISDNDADTPAQESILSASPSRTTYNNPTEWGTLILQ